MTVPWRNASSELTRTTDVRAVALEWVLSSCARPVLPPSSLSDPGPLSEKTTGLALDEAGDLLVMTSTVHDFADEHRADPFVRSVIRGIQPTNGADLWVTTTSDADLGTPAIGTGRMAHRVIVPTWQISDQMGPDTDLVRSVILTIDARTGEQLSRCYLAEFTRGERVALVGTTDTGMYAIGTAGLLCAYEDAACGLGSCVRLRFDKDSGRLIAPAVVPAALSVSPFVHKVLEDHANASMEINAVANAKTPGLMDLSILTAEAVARIGLRGMFQGKRAVVPGVINKVNAVLSQVLHRGVVAFVAGWLLERANRQG